MNSPLDRLRSSLARLAEIERNAMSISLISGLTTERVLELAGKHAAAYGTTINEALYKIQSRASRGEKIDEDWYMSEIKEEERRRLYAVVFNMWQKSEPPKVRLITWLRWKKQRPVWRESE